MQSRRRIGSENAPGSAIELIPAPRREEFASVICFWDDAASGLEIFVTYALPEGLTGHVPAGRITPAKEQE
jgi:hypothetical protein